MAVNLTELTNYVEQNANQLVSKASLGAPSIKYFKLQTGVKGPVQINVLNTSIELGNGKACGFTDAGESKISQRKLNPWNAKVNRSFCHRAMVDYFMASEINIAAGREQLPFAEQFCADIVKGVNEEVEKAVWNGITIGGTKYDGLLDVLADAKTVGVGDTIYDTVKNVYRAIPAEVLADSAIFLGVDSYQSLVLDFVEKNLYNWKTVDNAPEFVMTLPGTNTRIIGVPGLVGKGEVVALPLSETVYGVDMQDDAETFRFKYSEDNDEFRLMLNFNGSVQVAYPDHCVVARKA